MDTNLLLIWWYLRRKRRNNPPKKAKRNYWINPFIQERYSLGTYDTLMGDLRSDGSKFLNYFGMTETSFDDLLGLIADDITVQNTQFRECICPEQRLAICLRYFVAGCSFRELHLSHRVGISTVSKIVREIGPIIWKRLEADILGLPNTETEWEKIADGFKTKTNFPHCLGAAGQKYIRIIKPTPSVIWLAIADSEYRFTYINVRPDVDDYDVMKDSEFYKKIDNGTLNVPKPRPLHEILSRDIPYVLVGDESFALDSTTLRPYGRTSMDSKKKIFNYRLERARRYVDCAFALQANKWRILNRAIDLNTETAIDVIKACSVLHNFVINKEGLDYENNESILTMKTNVRPKAFNSHRGGAYSNGVRKAFADFFVSDVGSIPEQTEIT